MSQIDLNQYIEPQISKRYEIIGILTNIHGEHSTRNELISKIVFDETKAISEGEKEKIEKKSAKTTQPEIIHTFPRNERNMLVIPWGGMYGYCMGSLRTAMTDLYKDKMINKNWEGYGIGSAINHSFNIIPQWLEVGEKFSNLPNKPIRHQVITQGIRKSMVPAYYDIITKVEIKFIIEQTNTKISEEIFLPMLAYIQRLGLGPKGRGQLQIIECIKTKSD